MNDLYKLLELIKMPLLLCLGCTILSCSSSGSAPGNREYYDEDGSLMTAEEFQEKWRDRGNNFARWDSMEDGKMVSRFTGPRYRQYVLPYASFRRNLEKTTGREFDPNTIFLLEYQYKNDQCSSRYSDIWNEESIKERKSFLDPQKLKLEDEYPNLRYFHFFEEGVQLDNQPNSDAEYFFSDQENFLRETIFKDPAMCGSFAIIKPSGEVLVYNGESRPDVMARHLKQNSWNLFFGEN